MVFRMGSGSLSHLLHRQQLGALVSGRPGHWWNVLSVCGYEGSLHAYGWEQVCGRVCGSKHVEILMCAGGVGRLLRLGSASSGGGTGVPVLVLHVVPAALHASPTLNLCHMYCHCSHRHWHHLQHHSQCMCCLFAALNTKGNCC